MRCRISLKVIHYQHCGVGVVLTHALRQMGISSSVLAADSHPFGFKEDFLLPSSKIRRYFAWRQYACKFDILHSHHAGRLPEPVLNLWKGRFIQHYHDPQIKQPYYNSVPALVSLPNMLKTIPNATWIPLPVESELFFPRNTSYDGPLRIGFCDQTVDKNKARFIPKPEIKQAIIHLNGKAVGVPLQTIIPHDKMPEYYQNIDIWIDRVGLGFYGFAACEVASMGVPVITQIDEEILSYIPNCPFVNVKTREDIREEIINLVTDEILRLELGKKSREFAVNVHGSLKVAKLCLAQYEALSS